MHKALGIDPEYSAMDSRLKGWQKLGHMVGYILLPYLWKKADHRMSKAGWSEYSEIGDIRFGKRSIEIEGLFDGLSLVNFLLFLYSGKYRSLLERALHMRIVNQQRELSRNLSFDYMNREMVWNAFMEFFAFLMPLINLRRIRGMFTRVISGSKASKTASLPLNICAICVMMAAARLLFEPIQDRLWHVYCYFCISSSMKGDPHFECPRCRKQVQRFESAHVMIN
ncbi:Pex12 amino terminal region-domain-containing protein [Chytridium lagenaria]|nr:Pex12 amino terminal region-domain-containing protein [Chytridium lagenaria]